MQATERRPICEARYGTRTGYDLRSVPYLYSTTLFAILQARTLYLLFTYHPPATHLSHTPFQLLYHKRPTPSIPRSILNLFFSLGLHPNSPSDK